MATRDQFGSIAAGELRKRVQFQMPFAGQDSTGAPTTTWETQLTCWARVQPMSGSDLYAAQQIYPAVTTEIIVRGRVGLKLDSKMRMLYAAGGNTSIFDLIAIMDVDERHIETRILATQRPLERASK